MSKRREKERKENSDFDAVINDCKSTVTEIFLHIGDN
jgi:hypothetical protein